ncbi:MAG: NAD(P)H-binding protein, partial [Hyphomicrobiales bacterium]|nr:NAD(P)H-binding protein [Hyphomicrobiales bacterium]
MKIVIFGATGSVGRELVAQGLARGHDVTAFVRDPGRLNV